MIKENYSMERAVPTEFFEWVEKILDISDYQIHYHSHISFRTVEELLSYLPKSIKLIKTYNRTKELSFLQERDYSANDDEDDEDEDDDDCVRSVTSANVCNQFRHKEPTGYYFVDRQACYIFDDTKKKSKILIAIFQEPGTPRRFSCIVHTKHSYDEIHKIFSKAYDKYINRAKTIIVVKDYSITAKPVPNVKLDEVFLDNHLKEDILNNINQFFVSKELYKKWNVPWRRGVMFIGKPGNGKTMLVKALAHDLPYKIVLLEATAKTESDDIERWFDKATKVSPSVAVIEDLSQLWHNPNVSKSFFLNLLDGVIKREGVFIVATDNHPEELDPALTQRPSRFDRVFFFNDPSKELKKQYMEKLAQGKFSADAIDTVADFNMSFAFCKEIIINAFFKLLSGSSKGNDETLLESFEELKKHYEESEIAFANMQKNKNKKVGFGS